MIPCQKDLFSISDDVVYLNCAFTSPLMKKAHFAGKAALDMKQNPWMITSSHFFSSMEDVRLLFGELIGSNADNIALIPAVSYGISIAAKNIPIADFENIVVLEEQFPSNIYAWQRKAKETGCSIKIVKRPKDNNWTNAVLNEIDKKTAVAALPNCHWTDGTTLDLSIIGEKCRENKTALVIDGTQSLGAMAFDVNEVKPDFLITAAHKWLLGPYGFGFCYIAPKWQDNGIPLEENWLNRKGSEDFSMLVDYREQYQPGARRFDVGEASNFSLTPIVKAALEQILAWKIENISQSIKNLIDYIRKTAEENNFSLPLEQYSAPHMTGILLKDNINKDLGVKLAENKIFVSIRGNNIRISPHLYNSKKDIDSFFNVLHDLI